MQSSKSFTFGERSGTDSQYADKESVDDEEALTPLISRSKSAGSVKRWISSDMKQVEIVTKHTVAALFLGESSSSEAFFYNVGVRNKYATGALWASWYVGAIVGLLVVGGALPLKFVWMSLLMLPLPAVAFFLLSVDLIRQVTLTLDVYIIGILQLALFIDGLYYCRGDLRRVFWYCYLPSMIISGLLDAYPAKYRPLFAKLFFSASLVILVIWNFFLIFKWDVLGTSMKMVNVSFAMHHISDQMTLFVFVSRHLWASVFRPNYYIMIKADVLTMRTVEASVREPRQHPNPLMVNV